MSECVFFIAKKVTFWYAQKNFDREDMKMATLNLKFVFFQATRFLSLRVFFPLINTLKDLDKSFFFMRYNIENKGY